MLEFSMGYTPQGVTLVGGWGSLSPFFEKTHMGYPVEGDARIEDWKPPFTCQNSEFHKLLLTDPLSPSALS